MKTSEIQIGELYAMGSKPRNRPITDAYVRKVKVLSTGQRRVVKYTTRDDGVQVEYGSGDAGWIRTRVVSPASILATWADYETARDLADEQRAAKRAYYKQIADALRERGIEEGHGDGKFSYQEHRDGTTSLDIPKTLIGDLLGVER